MKYLRLWFRRRRVQNSSEMLASSRQEQSGVVQRLQQSPLQPKLRMLLFGTVVAASIGVSAESIHASPGCQRLLHTYREKLLPNKVSKTTAARWARWNKTHPNFHPQPRPRYVMTKEETNKHLDFACEVDYATVPLNQFLLPGGSVAIEPLLRTAGFTPSSPFSPQPAPGLFQTAAVTPLPLFPAQFPPASGGPWQAPPAGTPVPPTDLAPVPEPSSLILLGTGLVLLMAQRRIAGTRKRVVAKVQ